MEWVQKIITNSGVFYAIGNNMHQYGVKQGIVLKGLSEL